MWRRIILGVGLSFCKAVREGALEPHRLRAVTADVTLPFTSLFGSIFSQFQIGVFHTITNLQIFNGVLQ